MTPELIEHNCADMPGLAGWRSLHVAEIGSTNAVLGVMARTTSVDKLWLSADMQQAGVGRRSRHWVSPVGNFYGSVLIRTQAPVEMLSTLAFVASLAAKDAICNLLPETAKEDISLKWPNDVLLSGAKCAGLLLEAHHLDHAQKAVVIGFGVNLLTAPTDTPYPATALSAAGADITATEFLSHLAARFAHWLEVWQSGNSFSVIRFEWLKAAHGIGQHIIVNLSNGALEGIFAGIDADGHLKLTMPDGHNERISAGDVFFS